MHHFLRAFAALLLLSALLGPPAVATPVIPQRFTGAQLQDATLDAFAGATCSATHLLYCSGTDAVTAATLTAAGLALLDDTDAAAQRATLGLDTAALYAADTWDYTWAGASGATGWTTSGSAMTAPATFNGKSAFATAASPTSSCYAYHDVTAPSGDAELRAMVWFGGTTGASGPGSYIRFDVASVSGFIVLSSTGVAIWNTTALVTMPFGTPTGQWVLVTLRVFTGGSSSATAVTGAVWLGEQYVGAFNWSNGAGTGATNGRIQFGRTGTSSATNGLAWVKYRAGTNAAPPSYTYRGQGYGAGVSP